MRTVALGLALGAMRLASVGVDAEQETRSGPSGSEPPAVVVVMLDDVGYGDLPSERIRTPIIDGLLEQGTLFTHYYAWPVCSPTRAAMLTGHHPSVLGIRRSIEKAQSDGIPEGVRTTAELFRDHGYATGHFGKWHLSKAVGGTRKSLPPEHGFLEAAIAFGKPSYVDTPMYVTDGSSGLRETSTSGHLTEVTTGYAVDFIERHAGDKFFLQVWYHAPHLPLEPPQRWVDVYSDLTGEARLYAAMLSHADEQIGRLLAVLPNDSLLIVTSDNGPRKHGTLDSNSPLRGFKGQLYEGGIRVPLIVRWPGVTPAGGTNSSVVVAYDWMPTFSDLLGKQPCRGLPGRSLRPALSGQSMGPPGPIVWQAPRSGRFAIRHGPWKLLSGQELYLMSTDPGEMTNLIRHRPAKARELLRIYQEWSHRSSKRSH
jgi:arylsulfatase A-like enzyme